MACALSGYISVNPFTSCVTDRYQHKQCIIRETEPIKSQYMQTFISAVTQYVRTSTDSSQNLNEHESLHVLRFYWLFATSSYIFVNLFTSCVAHGNYRLINI